MANDENALNSQPLMAVPSGREASLDSWTSLAEQICPVDPGLYVEYDVKRGLRDQTGKGVLAGLTLIGDVVGQAIQGDQLVPAPGKLYYRGMEVTDLVSGSSPAASTASKRARTCCSSARCPPKNNSLSSRRTSPTCGACHARSSTMAFCACRAAT